MSASAKLAEHATVTNSLLPDVVPDELLEGLLELGYCTWQPGSRLRFSGAAGTTRLLLVLDGILECRASATHTRVLPGEFLRLDGSIDARLNNLSQADSLTALDMCFKQTDDAAPLAMRQCYFSVDQRQNKLCLAATPEGDHLRLTLNAPFDVHIAQLGRYETVILENQDDRPQIVVVMRGCASINTVNIEARAPALISHEPTLTITSLRRCEVITLRSLAPKHAIMSD